MRTDHCTARVTGDSGHTQTGLGWCHRKTMSRTWWICPSWPRWLHGGRPPGPCERLSSANLKRTVRARYAAMPPAIPSGWERRNADETRFPPHFVGTPDRLPAPHLRPALAVPWAVSRNAAAGILYLQHIPFGPIPLDRAFGFRLLWPNVCQLDEDGPLSGRSTVRPREYGS